MNIAIIIGEIAYISRARIMNGIVDAARRDGNNVILFTCEGFLYHHLSDYSKGEYNIFNLPDFTKYDGVIADISSIENHDMRNSLRERITEANIPCVSFNQSFGIANEINFDNETSFKKLIEHLITEHGVSNIHYVSGPLGNRDAKQRFDIFKSVLKSHSIEFLADNFYEGDFNFGSGQKVARDYIKGLKQLPQAFVCANDFMAMGLMQELTQNGIKVPEDVLITGYDNSEIAALTTPRLTTVDKGDYDAGIIAYEKLISSINNSETRDFILVDGKPVFARSCGCESSTSHQNDNTPYDKTGAKQTVSAVDLKIHMDESLDFLKGLTLNLSNIESMGSLECALEMYINRLGMEYFYFCQCGSRESYYEELELQVKGQTLDRDTTKYTDTVWCPLAYENGKWSDYPSFDRRYLFPNNSILAQKGGYYIVMPVHQNNTCIGYSIIGNFDNSLSGRVLQHLIIGIDAALGNIMKHDIMSTMLARISAKWQYDELTGLYNRSGLITNAEILIKEAVAADKGISVTFWDLDGLKAINDQQGHEAGDHYIQSMANLLRASAREKDIICRYGGDEFLIISMQDSRLDSIKYLDELTAKIVSSIPASAGCAYACISGTNELKYLIELADCEMYKIKRERKSKKI